jgi:putative ABC transport system substrate-binding protein
MDRRAFLAGTVGVLAAPCAGEAQQAGRTYRIGVLLATPPSGAVRGLDAFRQGFRELGHVEGQTYLLELRSNDGDPSRWPALILELIRLHVDILVVPTTGAALAAQEATRTIPIVSSTAGALVEAGVVASLARPGGNVTGLTNSQVDLSAKRLELLKETVPGLSRVAALTPPYLPASLGELFVRQTQTAARALSLRLEVPHAEQPSDLEGLFQAALRAKVGAVVVLPNPFFSVHAVRVAGLALQDRLPMIAQDPSIVQAGGLMQYGVHFPDLWRHTAVFVDKIIKGARPADLPVEQPTKFELVINLKTAKALGPHHSAGGARGG